MDNKHCAQEPLSPGTSPMQGLLERKVEEKEPEGPVDLKEDLPQCYDKKGRFRVSNKALLLTYKTHIEKGALHEFLNKLCRRQGKKIDAEEIIIAHENGEGDGVTPYEHTHVYVDFGYQFQSRDVRVFDFGDIHPHIARVRAYKADVKRVKMYVCKEDPELFELRERLKKEAIPIFDRVIACKTIQEALRTCASAPSHAPGVIAMYNYKEQEKDLLSDLVFPEEEKLAWHLWLDKELEKPPSRRKIYWMWDSHGEVFNKTRWALHHRAMGKAIICKSGGSDRDFATYMQTAIKAVPTADTLIFDLPRKCETRSAIYSLMESVKDRILTVMKYQGCELLLRRFHIVVLANWCPMIFTEEGQQTISIDRIIHYCLDTVQWEWDEEGKNPKPIPVEVDNLDGVSNYDPSDYPEVQALPEANAATAGGGNNIMPPPALACSAGPAAQRAAADICRILRKLNLSIEDWECI